MSSWINIWESLPKNQNGSSIVVTTRFKSVANTCSHQQGRIHMLKPLSYEESKKLFFEIIQDQDPGETKNTTAKSKSNKDEPQDTLGDDSKRTKESNDTQKDYRNTKKQSKNSREELSRNINGEESKSTEDPDEFVKLKEDIIRNCGGLPLAIVVVAGLLARRDLNNMSHWKTVKESLTSELDKNLNTEGVTQILNLCYNDLPADQKNCLLYLSIFPKGCSINMRRLTRRWIAEGFIVEKDGKTVEEVAEDTFNELISRNIVRPVDHSSNGNVKACQVHDMILEYIVSKSSEENFITVVGGH